MSTEEMPASSANRTIPNPSVGFGGGGQTSTYSGVSPAVIALVAMLGCVFFLVVCFRISVKCLRLFNPSQSSLEEDEEQQGGGDPRYSGPKGLDEALVRMIPVFTYGKGMGTGTGKGGECAVCLSEFEVGETVRLLPGCKHDFHMGCLDAWLSAHSTCPLCRAPVFPALPSPLAMSSITHEVSQEAIADTQAMAAFRAPSFAHATFQGATGAASPPSSSSDAHAVFPWGRSKGGGIEGDRPSPWEPWTARAKPSSNGVFPRSFSVGASLTNSYGPGLFLSPSPSPSPFPANSSNTMEGKKKKKKVKVMMKKGSTPPPASPCPSTSTSNSTSTSTSTLTSKMMMKRSFSVGVGRYLSPKE